MSDADDRTTPIAEIKEMYRRFAAERQWEPYHTPKNLCMALACEVAELMEHFQWTTGEESRQKVFQPQYREAIADELADILGLVMQLSIQTGIDLSQAARHKMAKNVQKYPVPQDKAHE